MDDKERDIELDGFILEHLFGWQWVQPPKWDINGPLPEQGLVLVSPSTAADVARKVHDWPHKGVVHPYAYLHGFAQEYHFSIDASADYTVLVRARKTWDAKKFERFYTQLWHTWARRQDQDAKAKKRDIGQGWGAMPTYYEPGDYSQTVRMVIEGTDKMASWLTPAKAKA